MPPGDDELAALEHEFSLLLRRARSRAGELSRQVHPELDGSAYVLLSHVAGTDGLRAADLAALFGVDKGAISRQVARLEQVGLVERRADPTDGRALLLVATDEGRQRIATATASRRARFRARLADWPASDVAQLAGLLARLNADLDEVEA